MRYDASIHKSRDLLTGPTVLNTTAHSIYFLDREGRQDIVHPCGYELRAKTETRLSRDARWPSITLNESIYSVTPDGMEFVLSVPYRILILCSVIALHAYRQPFGSEVPHIVGLIPAPEDRPRRNNRRYYDPHCFSVG